MEEKNYAPPLSMVIKDFFFFFLQLDNFLYQETLKVHEHFIFITQVKREKFKMFSSNLKILWVCYLPLFPWNILLWTVSGGQEVSGDKMEKKVYYVSILGMNHIL